MIGILQRFTEKMRQKRIEQLERHLEKRKQPSIWDQRYKEAFSKEPLPKSDYVDHRKLAAERIRSGKSEVAKKVNRFVAPVAGIAGFAIVYLNIWPTEPVRDFMKGLGLRGNFAVFLPIGLGLMVIAAIIASIITSAVERRRVARENQE